MYNDPGVIKKKDGTFRIERPGGGMRSVSTEIPAYARGEDGRPIKYQTAKEAFDLLESKGLIRPIKGEYDLVEASVGGHVFRVPKRLMSPRESNRMDGGNLNQEERD